MDEKTRRINGLLPEATVLWLERVAKRNKWTLSRAMRWAIHETMAREYDKAEEEHLRKLAEEIAMSGDPPEDPNRISAKDAFSDDQN